jgi:hypothetical protein
MLPLVLVAAALALPQDSSFYATRAGGIEAAENRGGKGIARPLGEALTWLQGQQGEDGSWRNESEPDVGTTALALAALLGSGAERVSGKFRAEVESGVAWLIARQDAESGRIGPPGSPGAPVADHAVATLVLCEVMYFTPEESRAAAAQSALVYLIEKGGPTSFDAATCGWSVLALRVARDAGLEVPDVLSGEILAHLDGMSDESGHVIAPGDEAGEGMTAVALFARFLLGQRPADQRVMKKHANDLLAHALSEDGRVEDDAVLRHFGSYAMFQMGGSRHWGAWNQALRPELIATQRARGRHAHSWNPQGDGDRVRATALAALNLEVYFRYGPLD